MKSTVIKIFVGFIIIAEIKTKMESVPVLQSAPTYLFPNVKQSNT